MLDLEALDMQDGPLDGPSIQWVSDLDGLLGQGAVLNFPTSRLRQGYHTITATATDSLGLTNVAVVHLFALVQPPPQLSLLISGAQGYVTWPSSYTNDYVLQVSGVPNGGWTTLTNAPIVLDQLQGLPVNPSASAQRFYRLLLRP